MVQANSGASDGTVSWELDVTNSRLLQILAYVGPSIFGGVIILAGGLLLWVIGSALLDGDLARAIGVVTFVVLVLFARRYLPALLATNLSDPLWNRFSRRGFTIGSVFGALALLGSTQLHPVAPFAVIIASWVPVVLTAAFPTSGHVDRAVGMLVIDNTEVPLDAVRAYRTVSTGRVAICWISYTRGVPTAPRFIFVPSSDLGAVSNLIETGLEVSEQEQPMMNRTERLIFGLFGFSMVALGPVLWLILPAGDGQVLALLAGGMFGLFGILLLWYAYSA